MAKFEFWAEVPCKVIEIPDEKLEGLSDKEREKVILEHHIEWVDRTSYGGWNEIK